VSIAPLLTVALTSILRNRLRSFLTMLGIIIGVGAVIALVAIGQGAQSQIRQSIEDLGTNMIVVTPGSSTQGGVSRGAGTFNRLTVDDADKIRRESVLTTLVSPVIIAFGQIVGGTGNWRAPLFGVSDSYLEIRNWPIADGTFFSNEDLRTRKKVVVLGKTVADALFPNQDPVGARLRIRNVPMEVIGVLSPKGQTASGDDQDDILLAPYTTVQTRLSGHQFIAQILCSTSSPQDVAPAKEEVVGIMRESHKLAQWEEDDFTVRDQTQIAETAQQSTRVMTMLLGAIAGISLLVGGIGIMNIMLVSVTERTKEIGVRRAVGARESDILRQFLIESVVLSLLGGLGGLIVGVGGAVLLGRLAGWSTEVSAQAVVLAIAFSASVGIFFGFYPARRAASLTPIDALRWE
jgi:putative ABC transport system permease protein